MLSNVDVVNFDFNVNYSYLSSCKAKCCSRRELSLYPRCGPFASATITRSVRVKCAAIPMPEGTVSALL